MILKYKRMKHILLKYFRNANTHITVTGIINTKIVLNNTKILIDNKKIMLSDGENQNIIIDLQDINKIEILNKWHIILKSKNINVDIQQ